MQTDYIDLYQLHGGTINDPIEETIEAFEQLVKQGKIRYYGISSIRPNVIRKYIELSNIQSVMMQYSLLDRRPEEKMLYLLNENNISILARGVLAQGLLVNKPPKDYQGLSEKEVKNVQEQLNQLEMEGYSKTGIAVQYTLSKGSVTSAVIGFRTEEQLADVLDSFNDKIPETILQELDKKVPEMRYTEHG